MNMIEHSIREKAAFALAIAIALSLFSCDNRYNTSTLIINEILDPGPADPVVYVALSRYPDFKGGFKSYATSYDISSASSPALVFDSINWESKEESDAGEFWLFVVQDGLPVDGVLNDGDLILPAMRIILQDGKTTVINQLVFDSSIAPLKIITADFATTKFDIRFFIENPSLIDSTTRLFLRLGADLAGGLNLSQVAANHTHDIPIHSPALTSGFSFFFSGAPASYALLWLDIDGSGTLNTGDWISTADETLVLYMNLL
jgi:hypothetical protein